MSHDDTLVLVDSFLDFVDGEMNRDPFVSSSSDGTSRVISIRSLLWDDEDNDLPISSRDDV